MLRRQTELAIASFFLIAGLLSVFIWIPNDSETWMIETFRRQTTMGDAFVPMICASLITICAAIHLVLTLHRKDLHDTEGPVFDGHTAAFMLQFLLILAVSIALMYWTGPLLVKLFAQADASDITYRQMRGTYPYKIAGFVLGGFTLVFAVTTLIEGRMKWLRILSSLIAVAVLLLIFDYPFDSIILPPNGDW
jgi:hypothetical protein